MIKVCHITTVHDRYDSRILKKECVSLANAGYDVTLLVSDNLPEEIYHNVKISSIHFQPKNRLDRILNSKKVMFKKALLVDADIYHFHDPELIPVGLSLLNKSKKVIYDSHEDYRQDIKDKRWIPKLIRFPLSLFYGKYEDYALTKFSSVITVSPHIVKKFKKHNENTFQIANFPLLTNNHAYIDCEYMPDKSICFTGLVSPIWMHENVINSLNRIDGVKYIVAGPIESSYLNYLRKIDINSRLEYMGTIPQEKVFEVQKRSTLGIALLKYSKSNDYKTGTMGNTKLFEYMLAGIPIVCTDFILWEKIVEKWKCGICVSPCDVNAISIAVETILNNQENAKQMGQNGRKAVYEEYNWQTQESILLSIYEMLSKKL